MTFGTISISIMKDGEIEVFDNSLNELGDKNKTMTKDLLRACRFLTSFIFKSAEKNGCRWGTGYLWSCCEDHTYSRLKKLAILTGGHCDDTLKYVTWRPKNERKT